MKNATYLAFALLGFAACGDDGGSKTVDASTLPTTVTISGVASEVGIGGRTPQPGVAVVVYAVADDSILAMTTTDAQGAYTVSATSTSGPIDGYLKASKTGYVDTYLYPPGPLSSDFTGVTTLMLTPGNKNTATQIGGGTPGLTGKGWIGAIIVDGALATSTPVAGATLTATPTGEIHYNGSAGVPQGQATSTAADGIAYAFNVPAGQVTVTATKSGSTFKTHAINARPDVVTLTLITP